MNKLILILVFCGASIISSAQNIGGFPAKLKWKQISNDRSKIIFNPEFEKTAFQVQGIINRLPLNTANIGLKKKSIEIVLRGNTIISNAYVRIAPFKSEFYLNPVTNNFSLGTLPWTYLLSIHEYQHVLQFSNTMYGPTKLVYWFGGELAWGSLLSFTLPNWFLEGDAVRVETEYSMQGRGRVPAFLNGFREIASNDENLSYTAIRNGSINKNLPNHYPLGYLMINHGREKHGDTLWSTILKETAKLKGILYPFSRALKRNTGKNAKRFYEESLVSFKEKIPSLSPEYAEEVYLNKKQTRNLTSLSYFQFDAASKRQYAVLSSFSQPGQIVEFKDSANLITKHILGIRQSNYFDIYNEQILYVANYIDPRYYLSEYSDLVIYNINTEKLIRLTYNQKLFSPNFINEGEQIIAVSMNEVFEANLKIFDNEGQTIDEIKNPDEYYYTFPIEIEKNKILVGLRDTIGRSNLSILDLTDNSYTHMLPWTYHQIGIPSVHENKVYFSASFSGVDQVYEYNTETKKLFQVTDGWQSHYQPSISLKGDKLYFQEFSLKGNQIKSVEANLIADDSYTIKPLSEIIPIQYSKNSTVISTTLSDSSFTSNYNKAKNLFNFHSWTFNGVDPNYDLSLKSDNILETFELDLGVRYNRNEGRFGTFGEFTYSQWFPILSLEFSNQRRSALNINNERFFWDETEISSSIYVPLNFSQGIFYKNLRVGINHSYSDINFDSDRFTDRKLHTLKGSFRFQLERIQARKNIFTHLGVYTNWAYENAINQDNISQISLKNSFALPGVFINHNLILDADFQQDQINGSFSFSDNFNYARGYNARFNEEIYRVGVNYHLPLFYPNKGALGLIYLLRVRLNAFADYSKIYANTIYENNSAGAELLFDLKLFNAFNASLGLRLSQQFNDSQAQQFEFFIPLNRF